MIMLHFTCGERKTSSTIKKSQNIMNIILEKQKLLICNTTVEINSRKSYQGIQICSVEHTTVVGSMEHATVV